MNKIYFFSLILLLSYSAIQAQPEAPEEAKRRHGPDNNRSYDVQTQMIRTDHDFAHVNLLSINKLIFGDANIKSGYYYYYPSEYNLTWSKKTNTYDIKATYGNSQGSGRGRTTITATLSPDFSRKDLQITRTLLETNLKDKEEKRYGIADLIPLPMAQSPGVDFDNLGQFGVSENDISIRVPEDLSQPIVMSFTTSQVDELMAMFFDNVGLYGDVVIYPSGNNMPASIRIPFNLKIDSHKTYGKFELPIGDWQKGWTNTTDFPIILTHFHVLKKEANGNYQVYSWSTDDKEIPNKASIRFANKDQIPAWVSSWDEVERVWLGYTVKPCRSCTQNVKNRIVRAPTRTRKMDLEFTILTPLAFADAVMMKIELRSFQAESDGAAKVKMPTLTIKEDGSDIQGGTIYVPDGQDPEFEYLVKLYREDGTYFKASQWVKSTETEVVIGAKQIKELIPQLAN